MLSPAPTLRTAVWSCRLQQSQTSCCSPRTLVSHAQDNASSPPSIHERRIGWSRSYRPSRRTSQSTIRHASTISNATTSTPIPESSSRNTTEPALDWNTFFQLRKSRRWYQLGSSVTTSAVGFVIGTQIMTQTDVEPIISQIPLDPFLTMGALTFACAGLGWLGGPFIGTAMFNTRNGKYKRQVEDKEVEFYRRIKKWRVDPSGGSIGNPVPDYYGEKIGSLSGYKQWLKDQRAFNRKRQNFV